MVSGSKISVVVPVFNEAPSLPLLCSELLSLTQTLPGDLEVIFVDDGSTDNSWGTIVGLAVDPRVRGMRLRRNFGKAAALDAGFNAANGQVVFQLDADLQDDPAEIPRFLHALRGDVDIVSGWKRDRRDPWHKIWPSRVFNALVNLMTGMRLHDHNCGFKCFRAEVVKQLPLYGEMHRFLPVIGHARGFRVAEIEIRHRPRRFGTSKYGARRFTRGFLDLLTVTFLTVFGKRPLHLLGGIGLVPFALGMLGLGYLAVHWFLAQLGVAGYGGIGSRPLLMYSTAGVLFGLYLLSAGFLAELFLALNFRNIQNYSLREETPRPTRSPSEQ